MDSQLMLSFVGKRICACELI